MGRRFVALAVMLVVVLGLVSPARALDLDGVTTTHVEIPTRDGKVLQAWLNVPKKPGPHPIVLFPCAWWGNERQSQMPAVTTARRGYVTVSYTQRGFGKSGGEIDIGGPATLGDVSSTIDWLAAKHGGDPNRVGVVGLSYSAGVALLAAARDPRIRAVVALHTWADLSRTVYPNQTRFQRAVKALYNTGKDNGRPDAEMTAFYEDFMAGRNTEKMLEYVAKRSPVTYLDGLRRNRPAIMIGQEWNDLAYWPDQILDFFGRLQGPKRLEIRPGDHAANSIPAVLGGDNDLYRNVGRWIDAHVGGRDTGITREPPILVKPRGLNRPYEAYHEWSQAPTRRYSLGGEWRTGSITAQHPTLWSRTITHGINPFMNRGVTFLVSQYREALLGMGPGRGNPALVSRAHGMVWRGAPLTRPAALRGRPRFQLTIKPSAPQGTLMAYLVDIEPLGGARLIHEVPYTWRDVRPGRQLHVSVPFPDVAYDVPAGHRIGLVITTSDMLYRSENAEKAPITLGSSLLHPALLDLPVR